jgi:5-methylcytosine-specific restriction endonuclease McrA
MKTPQYKRGATARGYTYRWEQARKRYLAKHPLCVMCQAQGKVAAATVVDHIKPHDGDQALFWDQSNWQPLCATHHNATKQRQDKRGHEVGCGADGIPIDVAHHWNVRGGV